MLSDYWMTVEDIVESLEEEKKQQKKIMLDWNFVKMTRSGEDLFFIWSVSPSGCNIFQGKYQIWRLFLSLISRQHKTYLHICTLVLSKLANPPTSYSTSTSYAHNIVCRHQLRNWPETTDIAFPHIMSLQGIAQYSSGSFGTPNRIFRGNPGNIAHADPMTLKRHSTPFRNNNALE